MAEGIREAYQKGREIPSSAPLSAQNFSDILKGLNHEFVDVNKKCAMWIWNLY
jgi:hypothetical protein